MKRVLRGIFLLGLWLSALLNACIDTFISGLICHAAGQIEVLKNTLMNLKLRALRAIDENDENCSCKNKYLCNSRVHLTLPSLELENKIYEEITEAIKHYEAILEFVATIEKTFNWELFSQFLVSGIVLCISAFELTLLTPFSMQFLSVVTYQLCILIQFFLYCFYGNVVEHKSLGISDAVYMSEWYCFNKRINRSLWIIMEKAKTPITITAGKLVKLSLETFVSILRSSYSFYAVLRQVQTND